MPKPKNPNQLTLAEEKAVSEYIKNNGNQAEAYRIAFPQSRRWKDKTVWEKASRLFKKDGKVWTRVQEVAAESARQTQIDANFVLDNLATLAGVNLDDVMRINERGLPEFDFSEVTREQMYCLSEIQTDRVIRFSDEETTEAVEKVKIKTVDKLRALEMLGRHLKLFNADVNINAENFIMNMNFAGKE